MGNKMDLDRKISYDDANNFARLHDLIYMETTSENFDLVKDTFENIIFVSGLINGNKKL